MRAWQVRGAVYPYTSRNMQCLPTTDACECYGGAARRGAYLNVPEPGSGETGVNVVAIDTGTYASGSGKFYPAFGGNASATFFADSGYSAYGLGYRDFTAAGPAGLASYIAQIKDRNPSTPNPVVTNLDMTGDAILAPHISPYTLVPLAD